jgi:hypothetical protein
VTGCDEGREIRKNREIYGIFILLLTHEEAIHGLKSTNSFSCFIKRMMIVHEILLEGYNTFEEKRE